VPLFSGPGLTSFLAHYHNQVLDVQLIKSAVSSFYVGFDKLLDALAWVGMMIILFMALSIGLEVFLRRIVGSPTTWNVQVNELALLYVTFFAAVWVLRQDRHVRMTAIMELVSPKVVKILYLIGSAMGLFICIVITWKTGQSTWESIADARVLRQEIDVPLVLTIWPIPFGFCLMAIQFLRMIGVGIKELRTGL
jgi:C4-dicarboxylate transporter DctQ subunit